MKEILTAVSMSVYVVLACCAEEIHDAVAEGNLAKVKEIAAKDPESVNSRNCMNRTPLHIASIKGHKEIAAFLLRSGAGVDLKDMMNLKVPLHYASRHGHVEIIKLLLEAGADIHKGNLNRWQPLHYASYYNQTNSVKLLVEKGADVNARTKLDKWTPLHFAGLNQNWELKDLLIAKGADKDACSKKGFKPILDSKNVLELESVEPGLSAVLDVGDDLTATLRYKVTSPNRVYVSFSPELDTGDHGSMRWSPHWPIRGGSEGKRVRYFGFESPAEAYSVELTMRDKKTGQTLIDKFIPVHVIWKHRYPDVAQNPLFDYKTSVSISRGIPEYDKIYDALARKGVKYFTLFNRGGLSVTIRFGRETPLKAAQLVLRTCLSYTKDIAGIEIREGRDWPKIISIFSGRSVSSGDRMPIETVYRMASPAITKYEFFKLAGYNYVKKKGKFERADADKLFTEMGMETDIMKAEYLFAPDMRPEALPIYEKLYDAVKDGDYTEARKYVEERIRALKFRKKYDAGEWIPLFQDTALKDWEKIRGNWTLEGDGNVKGVSESGGIGLLMVYKHCPGQRYELEGEISFRYHGGVVMGHLKGSISRFMSVHFLKRRVTLEPDFDTVKNIPGKKYRKQHTNSFLIQVWDSRITAYINGECLYFNRFIQDKHWSRVKGRIGIGGPYHSYPGNVVHFSNLRMRKLTELPVRKTGLEKPAVQEKQEPDDIF